MFNFKLFIFNVLIRGQWSVLLLLDQLSVKRELHTIDLSGFTPTQSWKTYQVINEKKTFSSKDTCIQNRL